MTPTEATAAPRKLKVAEFTDNYGPGSNGLMFAVQALEGNLLDAGHEVVVVAPRAKGPNPHFARPGRTELRLPSIKVPNMPTRVANSRGFEKVLRQLDEIKPDVIHVHGFGPVGLLGSWAAKRTGIPMMLTWHTDFDAYADHYSAILPLLAPVVKMFLGISHGDLVDPEQLRVAEERFSSRGRSVASLLGLAEQLFEVADLVTAPSHKTADRCREMKPDVKVLVVPNGVDPLPPGPPPVMREEGPLILYAGRIAPEKGIPLLVEAFLLLSTHRPDARLMVVGDWVRYPKIKRILSDAAATGKVVLPGEQKREQLGAFYGMADIFAFASETDTQALVLHEAALAGLPIVSVDPGLRLVLQPGVNGEITRPTAASMAAGFMRVIDRMQDPEWKANAQATSKRLAGQWSIKSQADAMLQLYSLVADGRIEEALAMAPAEPSAQLASSMS